MSNVAVALACVPSQELARPLGLRWSERLARFLSLSHEDSFVRPLLAATSIAEAERHIHSHLAGYIGSRIATTATLLVLKPWERLTPESMQSFYADIQLRLAKGIFPEDISQQIDYVAYSFAQSGLAIAATAKRGWKRNPVVKQDLAYLRRTFTVSSAFDIMTCAVLLATEQPEAVASERVFRWLVQKAVDANDAYILLLSETGFILS